MQNNYFDAQAAQSRCKNYRQRILDISQQVQALHGASAFSCLEMVDCVYHDLMRQGADGTSPDAFIMSKGHGCMSQYVILEDRGILKRGDLDKYCKPDGFLGCHPDYGVPGIEASTGSLGHGMALATGMAYTEKFVRKSGQQVFVVLSDGEFQEGSTWEAMMMAANLKTTNLIALLDHNGFQSLGRTSETHPQFYPIAEKVEAFGWETIEVNGHDASAVFNAISDRQGDKPFLLIGNTVKGKGVSFMENVPIWHYRSPSPEEYEQATSDLAEVAS
jgi:transketolase